MSKNANNLLLFFTLLTIINANISLRAADYNYELSVYSHSDTFSMYGKLRGIFSADNTFQKIKISTDASQIEMDSGTNKVARKAHVGWIEAVAHDKTSTWTLTCSENFENADFSWSIQTANMFLPFLSRAAANRDKPVIWRWNPLTFTKEMVASENITLEEDDGLITLKRDGEYWIWRRALSISEVLYFRTADSDQEKKLKMFFKSGEINMHEFVLSSPNNKRCLVAMMKVIQ